MKQGHSKKQMLILSVAAMMKELKDLIATIDLEEAQSIKTISIGCYQHYRSWIFLPSAVTFEVSMDGVNFTRLQTVDNTLSVNETSEKI